MSRPSRPNIFIVDDDVALGQLIGELLADKGHVVTVLDRAPDALARIEAGEVEVLLTDLRMPEIGGMELIAHAIRHDPRTVVVAMTAFGDLDTAVRAVRAGAFDYLPKPFEPGALHLAIDKALAERAQRDELARLRSVVKVDAAIVARSAQMREVLSLVDRVAPTPASVLITGPSGTGKERIARAIHDRSGRRGAFVAVNCAAIPSELLESELFGVKKGAYTDARADRPGLFREANGGTIFLDELGDLPLAMQPKLLRVLQEREVRPLGGTSSVPIDVRVLSASRHDLRAALREGTFREDLYYRLAVVEIGLPALRERPDDIVPLAERALDRASARLGRKKTLSGAAARSLLEHSWPGNVRELENALERAVALSNGEVILPEDLPPTLTSDSGQDFLRHAVDRSWTLEELSRAYLVRVLERTGGNKKQAAALMGIDRRTILRWLGPDGSEEPARGDNPRGENDLLAKEKG